MVAKSLGYLAVASPDAKKWLEFGPEVLGMEAVEADTGSVLLRMDDADHRIAVQQGTATGCSTWVGTWAARMRSRSSKSSWTSEDSLRGGYR